MILQLNSNICLPQTYALVFSLIFYLIYHPNLLRKSYRSKPLLYESGCRELKGGEKWNMKCNKVTFTRHLSNYLNIGPCCM